MRQRWMWCGVALLALWGCDEPYVAPGADSGMSGVDMGGAGGRDDGPEVLPDVPPLDMPPGLPIPGTPDCRPPVARLWQLTPQQLAHTFERLGPPGALGPLEQRLALYAVEGEPYASDPLVLQGSTLFVGELYAAARELALKIVATPEWLDPCLKDAAPGQACVDSALAEYAQRALRRPPTEAEQDAWSAYYAAQRTASGHDKALELALRRIVMSPATLLRSEQGVVDEATGAATLTTYELADLIAYTLTDAPPDEALWAAAVDGTLADPMVQESHVRRLLMAPPDFDDVVSLNTTDGQRVVGLLRFFREWLDVPELRGQSHPDLNGRIGVPDERALRWLDNESMMFLRETLWLGDGKLKTILFADYTVYSGTLSTYYGLTPRLEEGMKGPTTGGRRGILMQGGFLTSHPTTTMRGKFIRERLLCQVVPPAPPEADMNLSALGEELAAAEGRALSPREVRARHMADPSCSGCHTLIDPLGFPFDGFDRIGLPRDMWDGFPVDTRGEIKGSRMTDGPVADAAELAERLSASDEVHDCFVRQLFHYVYGRPAGQGDTCVIEAMSQRFRDSGGDVRDLLVGMLTVEAARVRTPVWD